MQNPIISVSEDLNRELGYTVFTLSGIEGVVDRISYSVIRHGYDQKYLGETDWQAAFSWLEPEDAWYENNTLKFIVPPDVTWQLESQGYVLRLNLAPTIGDVSFDLFWPEVLPAESTSQPSNAQRLSGTRVKPLESGEAIRNDDNTEVVNPVLGADSDTGDEGGTKEELVEQPTTPELREPSKGANPAPVIFLIVAIIVLLGGVYWFYLRQSTLDEQPAHPAEIAGDSSSKTKVATDQTRVKTEEPSTEITKVSKLVVEPDEKIQPEEKVSLEDKLRAEMQTETILQNFLEKESTRETTQQTEVFESIEPALRRQVGE